MLKPALGPLTIPPRDGSSPSRMHAEEIASARNPQMHIFVFILDDGLFHSRRLFTCRCVLQLSLDLRCACLGAIGHVLPVTPRRCRFVARVKYSLAPISRVLIQLRCMSRELCSCSSKICRCVGDVCSS